MKTYIIKIPPESGTSAESFQEVLAQLHPDLYGHIVAFEIFAVPNHISICFTANEEASELLIEHFSSIIPDIEISEIQDFLSTVRDDSRISVCEVGLKRTDLLPLQDYRSLKSDSLSELFNVLAQCESGENILVQIVLFPRSNGFLSFCKLALRRKFFQLQQLVNIPLWFRRTLHKSLKERIRSKSESPLFGINVRAAAFSINPDVYPETRVRSICRALEKLNDPITNKLKPLKVQSGIEVLGDLQDRNLSSPFLLSSFELASIFHAPSSVQAPQLSKMLTRRETPPSSLPCDFDDPEISFFAETNHKGEKIPFGIRQPDRRRHLYVLGKSGSGKTKLLELLIREDLEAGRGVAVFDPQGGLVDDVLNFIPPHRVRDVVIFDPSDLEHPPALNPLENVPEVMRLRVSRGIVDAFRRYFAPDWSPRLEELLRMSVLTLMDTPHATLLTIPRLLSDRPFRERILKNVQDRTVKSFWLTTFAEWPDQFEQGPVAWLLSKFASITSASMIRNILGQPENMIDFRWIIEGRKIFLARLPWGLLGEETSSFLGTLALLRFHQAVLSRATVRRNAPSDFNMYLDEYHLLSSPSLNDFLCESRNFGLNLTMAHQFMGQLDDKSRRTILGNFGSMVAFRLSGEDAGTVAGEFEPKFSSRDLLNLGVREFCIKMSMNGQVEDAFSGRTLTSELPESSSAEDARHFSRNYFSKPLEEVKNLLGKADGQMAPSSSSRPRLAPINRRLTTKMVSIASGGSVEKMFGEPEPKNSEDPEDPKE